MLEFDDDPCLCAMVLAFMTSYLFYVLGNYCNCFKLRGCVILIIFLSVSLECGVVGEA